MLISVRSSCHKHANYPYGKTKSFRLSFPFPEKGKALAAAIPEVSADASLSDSVVVAGKPAAREALADVRARFAMA